MKMRFVAAYDGKEHLIEVERDQEQPTLYHVTLDGKPYTLDAQTMQSQIVSVLMENRSYDIDVETIGKPGDTLDGRMAARVRGRVMRFEILDERRHKMKAAQGVKLDVAGAATILSPMPGKVIKLLAEEGTEVKEGQGVVVIEAMKMENELRAPKAGKVKTVRVKEGDAVETGAVLVMIE